MVNFISAVNFLQINGRNSQTNFIFMRFSINFYFAGCRILQLSLVKIHSASEIFALKPSSFLVCANFIKLLVVS